MPRLPVVAGGPDVQQQTAHQHADHPGRGERALRQGHRLPDRGANRQGFYIPPTTTPTYTAGGTGRGSGVGRPGGPQDRRGEPSGGGGSGNTAEPGDERARGSGNGARERGRGSGGVGMAGLGRRGSRGSSAGGRGVGSEGANRGRRIWTELREDGGLGGWGSSWGKQAEEGSVGSGSSGARRRAGAPPPTAKLKAAATSAPPAHREQGTRGRGEAPTPPCWESGRVWDSPQEELRQEGSVALGVSPA